MIFFLLFNFFFYYTKRAQLSKRQTGRKTIARAVKQTTRGIAVRNQQGRVVARKNIPQKETVRKFAPIRIFLDETNTQQCLKVVLEPNYRVAYSLAAAPMDIFAGHYRSNPQRHHVWSDHIVVGRNLEIDNSVTRGSYINWQQLLNYRPSCHS